LAYNLLFRPSRAIKFVLFLPEAYASGNISSHPHGMDENYLTLFSPDSFFYSFAVSAYMLGLIMCGNARLSSINLCQKYKNSH